jgi:hypothetical protein
MDYQQRILVGGASCTCVSQRDSIGLHNVGGRMIPRGEFCQLYRTAVLCMLRLPVPLPVHSLHQITASLAASGHESAFAAQQFSA